MANPWLRLYAEFAHDPKVQIMPEAMQRRLVMLFCLRCAETLETLQEAELAFYLRITEAELAETKRLFIFRGFIDEEWTLLNWEHRQFVSDSSTDRTRRYRERKRTSPERHSDSHETKCDALDTESESESEQTKTADVAAARSKTKDDDAPRIAQAMPESCTSSFSKEKDHGKAPAARSVDVPNWVPIQAWERFVAMRKANRKPVTPAAATLLVRKLQKLKDQGNDPGGVLDQSTMNGWPGLYPIYADKPTGRPDPRVGMQPAASAEKTKELLKKQDDDAVNYWREIRSRGLPRYDSDAPRWVKTRLDCESAKVAAIGTHNTSPCGVVEGAT